jgi:hypothetical protein
MKSFAFRFERVFEWRQGLLDLEEAHLQRLYVESSTLEEQQRELRYSLDQVRQSIMNSQTLQSEELRALSSFHLKVSRMDLELRMNLNGLQARIAQQLAVCAEAKRQVKLLATIRTRKRTAWDRELDRELSQLADDSFAAKWEVQS